MNIVPRWSVEIFVVVVVLIHRIYVNFTNDAELECNRILYDRDQEMQKNGGLNMTLFGNSWQNLPKYEQIPNSPKKNLRYCQLIFD